MRSTFALLSLLCLLLFVACGAPGGGVDLGVVGNVTASSTDPQARPAMLVRYDGDAFVAWAEGRAEASLFWRDSSPRTYPVPPRTIEGGRAVAHSTSLDLKWEGAAGDPLPLWCRPLFDAGEIEAWDLEFALVGEP